MATAEPFSAGLDPAHIVAVCARVVGGDAEVRAAVDPAGVRVELPSRRAAWAGMAALGRTGYTAALTGSGRGSRDLIVTGWNADRLDARLTAMRTVMHHLADNPLVTATAAVRQFAALPRGAATTAAATEILRESDHRLRGWVDERAGICLPTPPAVLPAPKTVAFVTSMPPCEALILPVLLLTMLPKKVATLNRLMPA